MSEHTPRMNRLLIFIAVFLCLICGILFTQSSAGNFESSSTSVVSINTSDISTIEPSSDRDHHTNASISSGAPSLFRHTVSCSHRDSRNRKGFAGGRKRSLDAGWHQLEIYG